MPKPHEYSQVIEFQANPNYEPAEMLVMGDLGETYSLKDKGRTDLIYVFFYSYFFLCDETAFTVIYILSGFIYDYYFYFIPTSFIILLYLSQFMLSLSTMWFNY